MAKNKYVALNGDDVGAKIGQMIAQDDHKGLSSASNSIKSAHDKIDNWVKSIGGKKVTGSGDEAIYILSDKDLSQLEQIKSSYKKQSGHDLTIGIGDSMSQASKALIYGKLNGKNQIVNYDPSIEDKLAGANEEDEDSEANEKPQENESDELVDQDQDEIEDGDSEETGKDEEDFASDDQKLVDSPAQPKASKKLRHDDSATDESDDVDGIADEDHGTNKGEIKEDKTGEESLENDETDVTDENPAPQEMSQENTMDVGIDDPSEDSGNSPYKELNEEDIANPNKITSNPPEEDADPNEDHLSSMIYGDMQQDENGSEQNQHDSENSNHDELKQDIASALMAFKENKEMLEQAREQNPKLYQATLTMLRSMIDMAKKLGFAPEKDMAMQENDQQLEENLPPDEGGDASQQMSQQPTEQDMKGSAPEKKPQGRLNQ